MIAAVQAIQYSPLKISRPRPLIPGSVSEVSPSGSHPGRHQCHSKSDIAVPEPGLLPINASASGYPHSLCRLVADPSVKPMPRSGGQLLFWHKRYDLVPGAALPLFRGRKDCLDIETVLAGFFLASAPDFIDDGVPRHELFSH